MYLRDIDYLSKYGLSRSDPTQNHYKFKETREDDHGQEHLIITDTESGDDLWKIPLTKKLRAEMAHVKPGEWFYIIYNPPAPNYGSLNPDHLMIKQTLIDRKDISFEDTDCEVDLDDLEKECAYPAYPDFPDNID